MVDRICCHHLFFAGWFCCTAALGRFREATGRAAFLVEVKTVNWQQRPISGGGSETVPEIACRRRMLRCEHRSGCDPRKPEKFSVFPISNRQTCPASAGVCRNFMLVIQINFLIRFSEMILRRCWGAYTKLANPALPWASMRASRRPRPPFLQPACTSEKLRLTALGDLFLPWAFFAATGANFCWSAGIQKVAAWFCIPSPLTVLSCADAVAILLVPKKLG